MSGRATNPEGVKASNAAVTKSNQLADLYTGGAQGLRSTLEPQLEADVRNPTGYGASGLAAMNTAAQQSAGGAVAGATGAMGRAAARTRNAGGYAAAGDEAAREGARSASQRSVEIAGSNEQLKQQQRQSALKGLQGLYGTDVGASLESMGLIPGEINAGTNAAKKQPGILDTLMKLNSMAAQDAALA